MENFFDHMLEKMKPSHATIVEVMHIGYQEENQRILFVFEHGLNGIYSVQPGLARIARTIPLRQQSHWDLASPDRSSAAMF